MKISIITACYNNESSIEKTILSVIAQKYSDIEYIVIDGASKDKTCDIISKYIEHIDYYISEKDESVYEALNKGLEIANGNIICFLHADDVFENDEVLNFVMKNFNNNDLDVICGDIVIRNMHGRIVRYYKGTNKVRENFSMGIMPPHPAVFMTSKIYKKVGSFSLDYKIASDYDYLLRVFMNLNIKYKYISKVFVSMGNGGISNKNILSKIILNLEIFRIHNKNDIPLKFFKFLKKFPIRLKEIKLIKKFYGF